MNKKNRTVKSVFQWILFIVGILVIAFYPMSFANSNEYLEVKTLALAREFNTTSDWYVTAYQLKEGKGLYFTEGKVAAKICFWKDGTKKDESCFTAEQGLHKYHEVKELSIVSLQESRDPKKGVLFVAKHYGISITKEFHISIWVHNHKEDRFINVLPMVSLTDQAEYKLVPVLDNGIEGILITADGIWIGGEEPRYGPHRFEITIYKYSREKGSFVLVERFTTKKKYKSFNDAETIDVIRHELNSIRKYFGKIREEKGD